MKNDIFDAIVIGGSFAGLSAGMTLGRSMRNVLIIDAGKPCNQQTPQAHNLITHDGKPPGQITQLAKDDVMKYPTIDWMDDTVTEISGRNHDFKVTVSTEKVFHSKKILVATGIKDILPELKGFKECWGISALHCPYCHGYEVKQRSLGIIANGDTAFEMSKLISQWTSTLTLYTNGKCTLSNEHRLAIEGKGIRIVETEILELIHQNGYMTHLLLHDGTHSEVDALFSRIPFEHHNDIAVNLGCELNEHSYIKVDGMQKTTVPGVYAAGDCTHPMRSLSIAFSTGSFAGAVLNKDLIEEGFQ